MGQQCVKFFHRAVMVLWATKSQILVVHNLNAGCLFTRNLGDKYLHYWWPEGILTIKIRWLLQKFKKYFLNCRPTTSFAMDFVIVCSHYQVLQKFMLCFVVEFRWQAWSLAVTYGQQKSGHHKNEWDQLLPMVNIPGPGFTKILKLELLL